MYVQYHAEGHKMHVVGLKIYPALQHLHHGSFSDQQYEFMQ